MDQPHDRDRDSAQDPRAADARGKDASRGVSSGSSSRGSSLSDTLRWAFELDQSPALAGANWLTREIIPDAKDPFDAILAPATTLEQLRELKNAYKMLRTTGVTAPERSLAARLYAATIAAALVRYKTSITTQAPAALSRAFAELAGDDSMPERLREIASLALTCQPPPAAP